MEILKVENLKVEVGGREVLRGVNLKVKKGEKLFLIGDNGAGKSTLVEAIMGFVEHKEGKIFLKGKEVKEKKEFRELRKTVGYCFQNPDEQLFCPTVEEEIAFGPLALGRKKEEVRKVVDSMLKEFQIEELRERPTFELSGGEKRIVSIAAVLAMEPELLILDEPTNALDSKKLKLLTNFLKNYNGSLIVITHHGELLKELDFKVLKLEEGILKFP
ncbi:energy-coupling factor ABC transporter ATP-binding protein [Thermovibrio sp.]